MQNRDSEYQAFLDELGASLDEVLRKMDRWEDELATTMRKNDEDQIIEVARKGGAFSQSARDARDDLLVANVKQKDDLSDGALDEAKEAVLAKCNAIEARLQKALDEVLARQESIDDKMKKTLEDMEGLGGLDFYPDGDSSDDLSQMKKKYDKEQKDKK